MLSTPLRFGVAGVQSSTAKTRATVPPVAEGLPAPRTANPFSTSSASEQATFPLFGSLSPALLLLSLSGILLAVAAVVLLVRHSS